LKGGCELVIKRVVEMLQNYHEISNLMGNKKDSSDSKTAINILNEISNKELESLLKILSNNTSIKKDDKSLFKLFIEDYEKNWDLIKYNISDDIIINKNNIDNWWTNELSIEQKMKYRIFELNVILYFMSKEFSDYINDPKKKLINTINVIGKNKSMDSSYNNIVV
jgi:hypothetical protein